MLLKGQFCPEPLSARPVGALAVSQRGRDRQGLGGKQGSVLGGTAGHRRPPGERFLGVEGTPGAVQRV